MCYTFYSCIKMDAVFYKGVGKLKKKLYMSLNFIYLKVCIVVQLQHASYFLLDPK